MGLYMMRRVVQVFSKFSFGLLELRRKAYAYSSKYGYCALGSVLNGS